MKVADKFSLAVTTYQRQAIDQVVAKLAPDTPLKAIVAGPEVQTALAAFERADAEALMAQIRYRRWNWRGLSATTFGILVGAVLLFPIDALIEGIPRRAIGALQTLALLISAIATLVMSKMKPLDAWREDRGKAEDRRTEIFQTILQSPVRSELAADGATGKLAIVKVAYLENQLAYFDRRGREHVKLSGKARPMQIVAYLMIGIATLLGIT